MEKTNSASIAEAGKETARDLVEMKKNNKEISKATTAGIAGRDHDTREIDQATFNSICSMREMLQAAIGEQREGRGGDDGEE